MEAERFEFEISLGYTERLHSKTSKDINCMFINIFTADKCSKPKRKEISKYPLLSKETSGKEGKMGNFGRSVSTGPPVHPLVLLSLDMSSIWGCLTWGKHKEFKKCSFPRVWEAVLAEGWKQEAGRCLHFLDEAPSSCSERKMRTEEESLSWEEDTRVV